MDVEGGDFVGEPRPNDRVRLLVVGDAGVGKSSLIHLACHGAVLRGATSTVGCHVDAKLHSYYGTSFFVEFVEVGGAEKFRSARSVFFMQRFDGVVMMHDLTNRNSRANLDRWRRELQDVRHDERHADGRNSAEFADEHGGGNGDGNGGMHDVDLSSNSRGSGSSRDPWAAQLPERSPGQALNRRQGASPGPAEEWVNTGEMGWLPCLTLGSKLDLLPPRSSSAQAQVEPSVSLATPHADLSALHAFIGRLIEHKRGDGIRLGQSVQPGCLASSTASTLEGL